MLFSFSHGDADKRRLTDAPFCFMQRRKDAETKEVGHLTVRLGGDALVANH